MTNKLVVIINNLKIPKIKKILLYEMKLLTPNYSCLQNPWLGGYRPQIPVLSVLCPTEFVEPSPPTQFLGTPLRSAIPPVRKGKLYGRCAVIRVSVMNCTGDKTDQICDYCTIWYHNFINDTADIPNPKRRYCTLKIQCWQTNKAVFIQAVHECLRCTPIHLHSRDSQNLGREDNLLGRAKRVKTKELIKVDGDIIYIYIYIYIYTYIHIS